MNAEFCLAVADAIEAEPDHFNMDYWFRDKFGTHDPGLVPSRHTCGSVCCIAGTAVMLAKSSGITFSPTNSIAGAAMELMGLDVDTGSSLFSGFFGSNQSYDEITAAEAAAEIRRLVAEEEQAYAHPI